tara:strand:- start:49 stop:156 length:108 start_codon:yes stop_codon:yes gene_type:complete
METLANFGNALHPSIVLIGGMLLVSVVTFIAYSTR